MTPSNAEFAPETALERALVAITDEPQTKLEFFKELVQSPIYILFDREWDGQSEPPADGRSLYVSDGNNRSLAMLALFTRREFTRAYTLTDDEFSHPVEAPAAFVLQGISSGCGAYINPNNPYSFRIDPQMVDALRDVIQKQIREMRGEGPQPQSS